LQVIAARNRTRTRHSSTPTSHLDLSCSPIYLYRRLQRAFPGPQKPGSFHARPIQRKRSPSRSRGRMWLARHRPRDGQTARVPGRLYHRLETHRPIDNRTGARPGPRAHWNSRADAPSSRCSARDAVLLCQHFALHNLGRPRRSASGTDSTTARRARPPCGRSYRHTDRGAILEFLTSNGYRLTRDSGFLILARRSHVSISASSKTSVSSCGGCRHDHRANMLFSATRFPHLVPRACVRAHERYRAVLIERTNE